MQLSGLASGMDTSSIVNVLVQTTFGTQKDAIYSKKQENNATISALGKLKSALETFKTAAETLADKDSLSPLKATSTAEDKIGVTAKSSAVYRGDISVEVVQKATASILQSPAIADKTENIGGGSFEIANAAGESFSIELSDEQSSIVDIAAAINAADDNIGVTATVVKISDDQYKLQVSANDMGAQNALSLRHLSNSSGESRLEIERSAGNLGGGLAVLDNATGTGFMMYTETAVLDRFVGTNRDAATNFIAVRQQDDGQWQYNNNTDWIDFEPQEGDHLIAELDYGANTTRIIEGPLSNIGGINAGSDDTDINVRSEYWNGSRNAGEFGISGSYFKYAMPNPEGLSGFMSGASFQEVQSGADAAIKINGANDLITRSSNEFDDLYQGINIDITNASVGDQSIIKVRNDSSDHTEAVKGLVDAYNSLNDTVKKLSAEDAALEGEALPRNLLSSIRSTFNGSNEHGFLYEFGVEFDRFGKAELDTATLESAIENGSAKLEGFFAGDNGIARSIMERVEAFTDSKSGMLKTREDVILGAQRRLDDDITRIDSRMSKYEARLQAQFSAMEQMISKFNSMGTFLAGLSTVSYTNN
ncbi:MAG: flagellar filament capping protein FliD [Gammaproteobacteria bacterium]|nr:flagellar filament capping protein FliD [Gammaproteobacteria bacterium]